jgi:hypothetical protein
MACYKDRFYELGGLPSQKRFPGHSCAHWQLPVHMLWLCSCLLPHLYPSCLSAHNAIDRWPPSREMLAFKYAASSVCNRRFKYANRLPRSALANLIHLEGQIWFIDHHQGPDRVFLSEEWSISKTWTQIEQTNSVRTYTVNCKML